jgi:transposase
LGHQKVQIYSVFTRVLEGVPKKCTKQDVSHDSVRRWKKKLSEEGEPAFFGILEGRRGHPSKLLPCVLGRIQLEMNTGKSVYSIAKKEGISEGSIRYWIKQGVLKKK